MAQLIFGLNHSQGEYVKMLIWQDTPPIDYLWFKPPDSKLDSFIYYYRWEGIPSEDIPFGGHIIPIHPRERSFQIACDYMTMAYIIITLVLFVWAGWRDYRK